MSVAHVDFETRSAVDLKKTGTYVYAESETTDVWCMAWCIDEEPVEIWLPGDSMPIDLRLHVESGGIVMAHNAAFERTIWRHIMHERHGWPDVPIEQWRCTMVMGRSMALPGSLENMSAALGAGVEKDMQGHRLMMTMAKPRRARKGDVGNGPFWHDDEDRRERLYSYCRQDVEAERAADKRLVRLRPFEQALWHLDQKINDRGVFVDVALCKAARKVVDLHAERLGREMAQVTDWEVTACSNINQLKTFCRSRGVDTEALDREAIVELLISDIPDDVRRALELRQEAGKASVAKIDALLLGMSRDGRAKGLLQFAAADTLRWGGRRFQPQNIKRPEIDDVDACIEVLLKEKPEKAITTLEMLYGPPLSIVGDCLRGMICAEPGNKLVSADLANIEGRVLAWLAGQHDKIQAFRDFDTILGRDAKGEPIRKGPDLYLVTAAGIYKKPVSAFNKKSPERQIGKVAELACGYGGGVGAFQAMAHTYGVKVPDDQADEIKKAWREANPAITRFWYDADAAAQRAVRNPGKTIDCGPVAFRVVGSFLWLRKPGGGALCYPYPEIRQIRTPWGEMRDALTYKTVPNVSNMKKLVRDPSNTSRWARISTYGGGLVENITQAVARDILAEGMVRLEENGYPLILTVHDEDVSEVAEGFGSYQEYEEIISELPAWAGGLPVAAEGWEDSRYRK